MTTIDVRIGHQNYFVVAEFAGVEIILADAGAQRGDDGANFFVAQHFVVPRLFYVENFSFEREDGLEFAVAAHFCGAAGGFALDNEKFTARGVAFLAIGELAGKPAGIHGGLAAGGLGGFQPGIARAGRFDAFADDSARYGGMFVEPFAKFFVNELLDVTLNVAIELAFGLPFKLRLRQTHADDRDEAFTHIIAIDGDFVFLLLEHAGGGGEIVDRARKRRAEPGKMRAAVDGIDGVGKGENIFAVGVVVLQGDFDFYRAAFPFNVDGRIVQRGFSAIKMLDEFGDAPGKAEFGAFFAALIGQRNFQAFVEKGQLAKTLRQSIETIDRLVENSGIGVESNFCASFP